MVAAAALRPGYAGVKPKMRGGFSNRFAQHVEQRGLKRVVAIRKNMKNKLLPLEEKILLRKRSRIDTVIGLFKHVCSVEHSRHRSPADSVTHLLAGLIDYAKQPSLHLDPPGPQPLLLAV